MSHYDWLTANLEEVFKKLNIPYSNGIIGAHADKCYSYKYTWEQSKIPFNHGVAIYLLSYVSPYSKEVRETDNGWIAPCQWVIDN